METFDLKNGTTKVIKLEGELDIRRMDDFKKALDELSLYNEVLIDLSEVTFITSGFISYMIKNKAQRPLDYKKIKILNPNNLIQKMFTMNQIDTLYEIQTIYPTAW